MKLRCLFMRLLSMNQKVFQIKPTHTIEELIEDELDARLVEERRGQAEIEIEIDDL